MAEFLAKQNILLGGDRGPSVMVPMDSTFDVIVDDNLGLIAYHVTPNGPRHVRVDRAELARALSLGAIVGYPQNHERLDSQIRRLAEFIMQEIPGEPSQDGGAVDTAIRILREWKAERDANPIFRHGDIVRIVKRGATWEGVEGPVTFPCGGFELIGVDVGDGVVISYHVHEIELVRRFIGPAPPQPGGIRPTIWERLDKDAG